MSGEGAKGFIGGKASGQNKDEDKKKPISRSSRADLQNSQWYASLLFLLVTAVCLPHPTRGDTGTTTGTAAHYSRPYLPTACYGNDDAQIPPSNMFAAAGEEVWDNGASCGRWYLVGCVSATTPGACNPAQTIQVRIIDRAQTSQSRPSAASATLVLSRDAFGTIANLSASSVNMVLRQV